MKSIMKYASDLFIGPDTQRYYPTHWGVDIPELDLYLEVPCFPKNQEIVAAIPSLHKFEGMNEVNGTIKGNRRSYD